MTEVLFDYEKPHLMNQNNRIQLPNISMLNLRNQMDSTALPNILPSKKLLDKKVYFCQRCLNHHRNEPRKNHKCDCPFADCTCELCILVDKRRVLNTRLHDLEGSCPEPEKMDTNEEKSDIKGKERVPNCQKCGQHNKKSRLKGHKRNCPYRDCECPKCLVVSERQKLMADQIKIRRRQRKDTIMSLTREHITSTINAAAALSAAGQINYGFNNLNALLYNQLKQQVPTPLMPSPTSDGSSYSPSNPISFTSSPDLLKPSFFPSTPPTPSSPPISAFTSTSTGLIAPVPINPVTTTSFPFSLLNNNEQLLQTLLANYKLFEQKIDEPMDTQLSNTIIDVCSV